MKNAILFILLVFASVNASAQTADSSFDPSKMTEKVIDAEFPGGRAAWNAYVSNSLRKYEKKFQKEGLSGTVYLMFIIDENGNATQGGVLSCKDAGVANCLPENCELAKAGLEIISKSPQWKPASLNGKNVKAYRRLPLTYQVR